MVTRFTANIKEWFRTQLGSTASQIKMNGTQSAGTSENVAREDHVHPTDTSRAASSHTHGSLANAGTLNSDITTVNKIAVTDASNNLKTISKLPANKVTHQDISGKLDTAGTGLSKSGTTVNHNTISNALTGKPTANQTPSFGGTATVSQVATDNMGHVTSVTDRTIKIPDTNASTSAKGLVQLDAAPVDASNNAVTSGGLFTALDAKQNAADTQSKIVGFTEKDRINIGRVLDFINNANLMTAANIPSPFVSFYNKEYYSLKLTGVYLPAQVQYSQTSSDKLPAENTKGMDLYCEVYKNGVKQESTTQSVTFKLLDGTVLGTSSTNSGNSMTGYTMIDHAIKLTDISCENLGVGIHYMYAEATINGSVVRSNILSVFVKDTENLFRHNVWSAGEYSNNIDGFYESSNNIYEITKIYSDIGENSLKLINNTSSVKAYTTLSVDVEKNKNYKLSASIYAPVSRVNMLIQQNGGEYNYITIYASNKPQNVSVTINSGDYTSLLCRWNVFTGYIYIDNIKLELIQ